MFFTVRNQIVVVAIAAMTASTCIAQEAPVIPLPNQPSLPSTSVPVLPRTEKADVDSSAEIETVEERYADGKPKVRREVTLDLAGNYVNHGSWIMFDVEGNEAARGKYENDRRVGQWTRKHAWGSARLFNNPPYSSFEGPFTSTAEFKNGKLHGKWVIKDSQDRPCSEWNYTDGLLDGEATWTYPSGNAFRRLVYKRGLRDGAHQEWTEDEKLIVDETYEAGRRVATRQQAYPDGAQKWEGKFLHERYEIEKPDDWWLARPVAYRKSGEPVRHGKLTAWYKTGQKQSEGNFRNNRRAGKFTWWHENTQIAVQGSYEDNQPSGTWTWWHANGLKAIRGTYVAGQPSGEWFYWDAKGKLSRRTNLDAVRSTVPTAPSGAPLGRATGTLPNN